MSIMGDRGAEKRFRKILREYEDGYPAASARESHRKGGSNECAHARDHLPRAHARACTEMIRTPHPLFLRGVRGIYSLFG